MVFALNLLTSVNLKSKIKKFGYSFIHWQKGLFSPFGGRRAFFYNLKQQVFLRPSSIPCI